jgi:hypothetical protein
MKIRLFFLALAMSLCGSQAFAANEWLGNVQLGETYTDSSGYVYFGLTPQPSNTCAYFAWYIRFDGSTSGGKSMLATILSAKLAGRTINIWYNDSVVPGTNQNTGCIQANMAVLTGVSIS